ncbi:MAG: SRPBCC family protein [Mariprofundaceae bacterium]|nr:SRPBCC family protein [Mariprofundaceae bacterium]
MALVQETFEIHAPPEQVFDLINDIEATSGYSELIQGIETIGEETYRYRISVAGIPLSWDAKVTERIRPDRICWESIRGITLKGCFQLAPAESGSTVSFRMEYHIHNRILALLLQPFLTPLFREVATEVMARLETRLS